MIRDLIFAFGVVAAVALASASLRAEQPDAASDGGMPDGSNHRQAKSAPKASGIRGSSRATSPRPKSPYSAPALNKRHPLAPRAQDRRGS